MLLFREAGEIEFTDSPVVSVSPMGGKFPTIDGDRIVAYRRARWAICMSPSMGGSPHSSFRDPPKFLLDPRDWELDPRLSPIADLSRSLALRDPHRDLV